MSDFKEVRLEAEEEPVCRQCGAPAVYRVELPGGCVCFPDEHEQFLCAQHWSRLEPLVSARAVSL